FGQVGVVRAHDHGNVPELRRRELHRFVNQNLAWRVRDVILAAHHVRHAHQSVIYHHGKVVGGIPVRTQDDLIADNVGVKADIAEDGSVGLERGTLRIRVFDAQDERAVIPAREEPVEQRRADVSHMQVSGGAGGKPDSHAGERSGATASIATAWTAIASFRPSAPTFSLVLPFTLTARESMPTAWAMVRQIFSMCGASFGSSAMT